MKKTTKKHVSVKSNVKENNEKSSSVFHIAIVLLLVVQIVLISGLYFKDSSIGSESENLSSLEEKVSRIDSFFANNVDGYGSAPETQKDAVKADISIEGEPAMGDDNAPVTIVEFTDYECPFCKRYVDQTYNQIKENYVDTGKVKYVVKDFPLGFHQKAKLASIAANCAFEQLGDDAYFKMHNKIFANQDSMSQENFKSWALEIGVDEAEYDTCINNPEIAAEVDADLQEGQQNGVSGTPSFFINGELVVGAQPYSVFQQKIDAALNN